MKVQKHVLFALVVSGSLFQSVLVQAEGPLGFGQKEIAQPLETDRPDFTEGTQTVTPGHLQIEAGYTFTRDTSDGTTFEEHTSDKRRPAA